MGVYHSEKANKETVLQLKEKVLAELAGAGIDVSVLDIRALKCYGGDVRVYTDTITRNNKRSSFRKTGIVSQEGSRTTYAGTRGVHSTTERHYYVFNSEDFEVERKHSMIDYNINQIKKFLERGY